MTNKSGVFSVRLDAERRTLDAIAQQLERTPGDTIRVLIRRAAHDLGVVVPAKTERTEQAQQRAA